METLKPQHRDFKVVMNIPNPPENYHIRLEGPKGKLRICAVSEHYDLKDLEFVYGKWINKS